MIASCTECFSVEYLYHINRPGNLPGLLFCPYYMYSDSGFHFRAAYVFGRRGDVRYW